MSHRALWAAAAGMVILVLAMVLVDSSPQPGITVPPRADPPATTSISDGPAVGPVAETGTGVPGPGSYPEPSPPDDNTTVPEASAPTSGGTQVTAPARNSPAATPSSSGRTSSGPPPNPGVRTIVCPDPRAAIGSVPAPARAEVDRELTAMGTQIADANQRLRTQDNPSDPNFVQNAIIGPLTSQRIASLDRIAIAIGRYGPRPTGLDRFAPCTLTRT